MPVPSLTLPTPAQIAHAVADTLGVTRSRTWHALARTARDIEAALQCESVASERATIEPSPLRTASGPPLR
jgi:hypothetical protein